MFNFDYYTYIQRFNYRGALLKQIILSRDRNQYSKNQVNGIILSYDEMLYRNHFVFNGRIECLEMITELLSKLYLTFVNVTMPGLKSKGQF